MNNLDILITKPSADYELLDSGDGEKLERFGSVVLSRPDPQALWRKKMSKEEWAKAKGHFEHKDRSAKWRLDSSLQKKWSIDMGGLKMWIQPTSFKHVGIFPEQQSNWKWIEETIRKANRPAKILNLFGYTGGATLASLSAGAEVVHVDGSKTAITWAKENAELSGLGEKPVRWILDDAQQFVEREIRRGNKYDGIIMDPPAFGHGPEGEVWKIEDSLLSLFESCKKILSDNPVLFLVNGYASGYSALAYRNILEDTMKDYKGVVESGELAIKHSSSERLLSAGIFARWRQF